MSKLRALFFRSSVTYYMPEYSIPFSTGIEGGFNTRISSLVDSYNLTGNKGNMIHRESLPRIVSCDRKRSGYVNLFKLYESHTKEDFRKIINENFDAVFFTMANFIRPGAGEEKLTNIVELIDVPLYVFGVGLQDRLPPNLTSLSPGLVRLLSLFNEKAHIFSTRGKITEKWLHSVGFDRAISLGCPSLYVYPKNIKSIQYKEPNNASRVLSAGHLHSRLLEKKVNNRAHSLLRLFEGYDAGYVFQSELFSFTDLLNVDGGFDPALGEVNEDKINDTIYSLTERKPSFQKYYYFNSTDAWRATCSNYDFYVGDRIHGGVAAMQSSVPSVIIYNDVRVKEICDYYSLPSVSVKSLEGESLVDLLRQQLSEENLSKFQSRYIATYRKFRNTMRENGLKLLAN